MLLWKRPAWRALLLVVPAVLASVTLCVRAAYAQ